MPYKPTKNRPFPSLGWLIGPHIERYLGIDLMDEQKRRLIHLYRLDERGRRVVRRAALRRPKGAGKSPEAGYIGFGELTGPVVFAGWDENGQPAGRPHHNPWIQFAAVSEDQTDNVSVWLYDVLASQPDTLAELRIDLGRTRIYLIDRPGRVEMVTASAGSREGQPITFGALDQSEAWKKENGGQRLAATLRRNAAKTGGWTYEFQNAPDLDDGSVAADTQKAWDRGQSGLFFDTREPSNLSADPEERAAIFDDRPALLAALREVYGESAERGFVDVERLADECCDPATLLSDKFRFYLNVPWANEDQWVDARKWATLAGTAPPDPDTVICAGFVGLAYQGAALVGCVLDTGDLFVLETWETTGSEMVSRLEVDSSVQSMLDTYDVRRFYVDPREWQSELDTWHLAHGDKVIAWWTHRNTAMAHAVDRLRTAAGGSEVHHDGNEVLTRHVLRARARKTAQGTLIVPRNDSPTEQITAAKAAVLAFEARADVLAEPVEESEPWFAFG